MGLLSWIFGPAHHKAYHDGWNVRVVCNAARLDQTVPLAHLNSEKIVCPGCGRTLLVTRRGVWMKPKILEEK